MSIRRLREGVFSKGQIVPTQRHNGIFFLRPNVVVLMLLRNSLSLHVFISLEEDSSLFTKLCLLLGYHLDDRALAAL